jgi:ribulose-5-phosphate 4-epimerase/fuculose-1-phosphate aldolase
VNVTMEKTRAKSLLASVSPEEAQLRRDLAAAYRLIAMYGWDDMIATHLSARVINENGEDDFLINPIGMFFEEITASSLIKVNMKGDVLHDTPYEVNRAGFIIHSAVHAARADARCVIHLHTHDGIAVSMLEEGLLPLNQTAMLVADQVAYHEFEGVAFHEEERERLAHDLGDKPLMMLRNHGTLAVGGSIAQAFVLMYMLETSCTVQIRAQGTGRPIHQPDAQAVAKTAEMSRRPNGMAYADTLAWPPLLRKLDRVNPGYDA